MGEIEKIASVGLRNFNKMNSIRTCARPDRKTKTPFVSDFFYAHSSLHYSHRKRAVTRTAYFICRYQMLVAQRPQPNKCVHKYGTQRDPVTRIIFKPFIDSNIFIYVYCYSHGKNRVVTKGTCKIVLYQRATASEERKYAREHEKTHFLKETLALVNSSFPSIERHIE